MPIDCKSQSLWQLLIHLCSETHEIGICCYSESLQSKHAFHLLENTVKVGFLNQIPGKKKHEKVKSKLLITRQVIYLLKFKKRKEEWQKRIISTPDCFNNPVLPVLLQVLPVFFFFYILTLAFCLQY